MLVVRHLLSACLMTFVASSWSLVSFAEDTVQLQVVTELSPPHQTLVDGEVAGLATDKVKALLQQAGISASFAMYPWARAYNKASSEPNTLIYSIAKSPQREDLFHWLIPVTRYEFGFVSLSERKDIRIDNWQALKNYSLVVQRQDIAHEWLMSIGLTEGEHFITCADIDCSWQLLLNNNVDLIIETPDLIDGMLRYFHQPAGSVKLIKTIPELAITGYLAANQQIDPQLLSQLQQAMAQLSQR